jgi:RimJ/RimL family protein N-acetyltransferase
MALIVREMELSEVGLIIDYFHQASSEHLEMLGVDPTRLPAPDAWLERYAREYARRREERAMLLIVWELDGAAIGFSTVDKIRFGREAFMHLHIVDPGRRNSGHGTECVRRGAKIYFEALRLERLYCEPNAFNVAPNRTLQKAGFSYVKTHRTVPGPLNFRQAVTRWVLTEPPSGSD